MPDRPPFLRLGREDHEPRATLLRLEGRLTEREIEELGAACRDCLVERRRLVLDLSGLRFADRAGALALASLRRRRVGLRGASGFIEQLLETVE